MRAGLFLSQELALLRRGCFQCPLGQAACCRAGDFLHLCEIHVEPRSLIPKGLFDDNFSPLLGQPADYLQFFGR